MASERKITECFITYPSTASAASLEETICSNQTSNSSIALLSDENQTLKAEILWTLKCLHSHYSLHSCEGLSDLFRAMFPGNRIAEKFACGETLSTYLCQFGLAPHFSNVLKKSINSDGDFVLLFDESFNKNTQSKQIDILIRLWDYGKVKTRYYRSKFFNRASTDDLLSYFNLATEELELNGLLQVSTDGLNANLSSFDEFNKLVQDRCESELIDIGNFGPNTFHEAFEAGEKETGWKLDEFLSGLYRLFKDYPALKDDFTGCSEFPLKFCQHRWLENGPVTSRAILLMENLKEFVDALSEKNLSRHNNKLFETVANNVKDPMIVAKLEFLYSLFKSVESFLKIYQVDKPTVPFIVSDTEKFLRNLMRNFIKPEVLENASSSLNLSKIDLNDSQIVDKDIQVGLSVENEIEKLQSEKIINDLDVFEFKENCRKFMTCFVQKITENSPIKHSVARYMLCLDPRLMADDSTACKAKMKSLLELFLKLKRLDENDVEHIYSLYCEYLHNVVGGEEQQKFKYFDVNKDRLDTLFYGTLKNNQKFEKLWGLIRKLLLVSHGWDSTNREFSDRRYDNIAEDQYVGFRIINDHISHVGGVLNVSLTKELLSSASGAKLRYYRFLEDEKMKKKNLKRKAMFEEVYELSKKAKLLQDEIMILNVSAEQFADEAEAFQGATSHSLIVQSNIMRRTFKEKVAELNRIASEINAKKQEIDSV